MNVSQDNLSAKLHSRVTRSKMLIFIVLIGLIAFLPSTLLVARSVWLTQQAEIVVRKLPDGKLEFCLDVGASEQPERQCPKLRMFDYENSVTGTWYRSTPILITSPDSEIQTLNPASGLYRTQVGDSMASVSEKFDISIPDLVRLNPNVGIILRAGQILTVDTDLAPAITVGTVRSAEEIKAGTYTVVSGDSLGAIADRFDLTIAEITKLNPSITNPNSLSIGQTLIVEGRAPPASTAAPSNNDSSSTYTVQSGDTLNAIAAKFSITPAELRSANQLLNPDSLSIGQLLVIPSK